MREDGPPDPERRFFGRRRGPGLTRRKQQLLAERLPDYAIAKPAPRPGALDPAQLFGRPVERAVLEIGFGKGEHLAQAARHDPAAGFIGCEPFVNGVAALLDRIEEGGLDNVRIYPDDARDILLALPPGSLARIDLIHPDPWPKRRHAARRFLQPETLDEMAAALAEGGELRVATDHPVYKRWAAVQMARRDDFIWLAERPADWCGTFDPWVATRYRAKAERAGRDTVYLRYRRGAQALPRS